MKRKLRSILALSVVLCMTIAMTGCSSGTTSQTTQAAPAASTAAAGETAAEGNVSVNTSERVDLVYWLLGDAPADMAAVQDKINEIMLAKINATVTFNFTTWTDYESKYNMILSSGEECDIVYAADWLGYFTLARNGAYLPLDDMIETCMPGLRAEVSDERWNGMRVDGKIYGVPSTSPQYADRGLYYRKDLVDKYGLEVPDTIEKVETYLETIKANEPEMATIVGFNGINSTGIDFPFGYSELFNSFSHDAQHKMCYGVYFDYNHPDQITDYWKSEQFREDMKVLKRWSDKGFWPKNIVSYQVTGAIEDGVCATWYNNLIDYLSRKNVAKANNPEWELGFVSSFDLKDYAYATSPAVDCTCIALSSKNPERAAMALDILMTDKEAHRLLMYGIEGEHYTVDENGYYVAGTKNDSYPYEGANTWNNRSSSLDLSLPTDAEKNEYWTRYQAKAETTNTPGVDLWQMFGEDDSRYAAEKAAITSVCTEYLIPIQTGMVDDVDAAIDVFLEKVEEAGRSVVLEDFLAQWQQYLKDNGYV